MLKSYQDFLKERVNENIMYTDTYDLVFEYIGELNKDLKYSDASFSSYANRDNGDERLDEVVPGYIEKLNKKFGEKTMKKIADELISSNSANGYTGYSGLVDVILYHYNNKFPLGGYYVDDYNETVIKYAYGWHTKKYGKMAIEQTFDSKEEYLKSMVSSIEQEIERNTSPDSIIQNTLVGLDNAYDGNSYEDMIGYIITGDGAKYLKGKVHYSVSKGSTKYGSSIYDTIFEIYVDGKSIATKDDWIKLFDQAVKKNSPLIETMNWGKILNEKAGLDSEEIQNIIKSVKGLHKFNI
jgi:hypothetical protein